MKPSLRVALALTALAGGVALGAAGCGAVGADASFSDSEAPPAAGKDSTSGSEDSYSDAGAAAPKQAYRGNPLCGADFSTCFPDPISLSPDAGDAGNGETCASVAAPADGDGGVDGGSPPLVPSACRVRGNVPVPMCVVAGGGTDGAECESGNACAPGFECVGNAGKGVCRAYCCAGECSSAGGAGAKERASHFCDVMPVYEASSQRVPVCNGVRSCELLGTNQCAKDETCAVVAEDGTTSCIATGTARAGESCDETHCESGLVCLGQPGGKKCLALCKLNGVDCSENEQCVTNSLFKESNVGVCQPKM